MKYRLIWLYILSGCLGLGVLALGWEIYQQVSLENLLTRQMNEYAEQQMDQAAQKISSRFQAYAQIARDAAYVLGERVWNKESLNQFLTSIVEKNPNIQGIAAGFRPYAFDESVRLHSPGVLRDGQKIFSVEAPYDYTLPSEKAGARTDWYKAMESGEQWTEPFWGTATKHHIIAYSVRFFSPGDKKTPRGVVFVIIRLDYVRKIVNELALGKRSYGFVISNKGTFVAHPREELYRSGETVFDFAKKQKNKYLEEVNKEILVKKSGSQFYINYLTGQPSMIFYQAVPETNLILGLIFIKEEFFGTQGIVVKRNSIKIALAVVYCLLLLIFLSFFMYRTTMAALVSSSFLTSLVLIGGISYLWFVQRSYDFIVDKSDRILIFDNHTIKKTVAESAMPERGISAPVAIKTGIELGRIDI